MKNQPRSLQSTNQRKQTKTSASHWSQNFKNLRRKNVTQLAQTINIDLVFEVTILTKSIKI
jgi:hypothetical protein